MHRVYIAAPLAQARRAARFAKRIEELGHKVVSTWHEQVKHIDHPVDPPADEHRERLKLFAMNRDELSRANRLLALVDIGTPRATYCEVGYFVALGHGTVTWRIGTAGEGQCLWSVYDHVALTDGEALRLALR